MPRCEIGSALANTDVRGEKRHAGQEKENPAEQADHIPVSDAGRYEEQRRDDEQHPSPQVVLLTFPCAVVGHMNLSSDQDGRGRTLTGVATVTHHILYQDHIVQQQSIQLYAGVVVWKDQPVPIPSFPSPLPPIRAPVALPITVTSLISPAYPKEETFTKA